jgi:hypothetical protein
MLSHIRMNLPVQDPFATSLGAVVYIGLAPMLTPSVTRQCQEAPLAPCILIGALAVNIPLHLHSQAKALFFPECPCRGLQLCLRRPFSPWPNMWICIPTPLYQFVPLPHNPILRYLATFHHAQKLLAERQTETDIIANSTFRRPCSLAFLTPAPRNVRTHAQRNSTTRHVERQGPIR